MVFSLPVFIQSAFFSAAPLYNFLYLFLFLSSPIWSLPVGLNSLNAALEGQNLSAKYIQQLSTGFGTKQIPYNVLHIYYSISDSWIFGKYSYLNFNVKLRTVPLTWFFVLPCTVRIYQPIIKNMKNKLQWRVNNPNTSTYQTSRLLANFFLITVCFLSHWQNDMT